MRWVRLRTQFTGEALSRPARTSTAAPSTLQPPCGARIPGSVRAGRARSPPARRLDRRPLLCIRGGAARWAPGLLIAAYSIHLYIHARDPERVTEAWRSKCMTSARLGQDACLWSSTPVASRREADSGTRAYMVRSSPRGGMCAGAPVNSVHRDMT